MAPYFIIGGVLIASAACVGAYVYFLGRPNPPLRNDQVRIGRGVWTVEIASTTVAAARGLSYRASLAQDHGMLFLFSPGIQHFWMKDMNFPLDMIWIGGGKVLGFAENVKPQPGDPLWKLAIYNSPDGTDRVLEVNAGAVAANGIKAGDSVAIGI